MSITGSSRFSLIPDASETASSPLASSESPELDCCWRTDGLRLSLVPRIGGRIGGAFGVVGDSGCEVMPVWRAGRAGSIDGSRSTSRTGRSPNPSPGSIGGTAAAIDCIELCLVPLFVPP